MNFSNYITDIPNYPTEGVVFKDITPLLADYEAFSKAIDCMIQPFLDKGITKIVGAEARGFIVGTAAACRLGVGFVPARKPGKLPRKTLSASYQLEYGSDTLEIHEDVLSTEDTVLIIDDVLATGGTAKAQWELCRQSGANVAGLAFLLELDFLKGRKRLVELGEIEIFSLVHAK